MITELVNKLLKHIKVLFYINSSLSGFNSMMTSEEEVNIPYRLSDANQTDEIKFDARDLT
jgi:hypothetical protein